MARSIYTIAQELMAFQHAKNDRISNFTELSVIRSIDESFALECNWVEVRLDKEIAKLSIHTATGKDLDALVIDRLPEGRRVGNYATGQLLFSRSTPAPNDIEVPKGTVASASTASGEGGIKFETQARAIIPTGEISVLVDAIAQLPGLSGNVSDHSITSLSQPPYGISSVTNVLPFSGGIDTESDLALRRRYIYAILTTGKATKALIEQHIGSLTNVREIKVFTASMGDVEIVVDVQESVDTPPANIAAAILNEIALGITSRGVIGAHIESGNNQLLLDQVYGGFIYLRPKVNVINADAVPLTYLTRNGETKTINVDIPFGTPAGYAVKAILDLASDRVVGITASDYAGDYIYDVLLGLGEYPYLWNMPVKVALAVNLTLRLNDTPELGLVDNVKASIRAFLDSYQIGERFEYSDLIKYILTDFNSENGRFFQGIDEIVSCSVTGRNQTAVKFGDKITIDLDERIDPGDINVELSI